MNFEKKKIKKSHFALFLALETS